MRQFILLFFSPLLKATDGKPQMHLAQQNATFTHLSCVNCDSPSIYK